MDPKSHQKLSKIALGVPKGRLCHPPRSILARVKKSCFLESSLVAQKIRKIGPKAAQEAPSTPRVFGRDTVPGGLGPWGGLARDMKLDTRSMKHES